MPFVLKYTMMTGTGARDAQTPDEALEAHTMLRLAGAGITSITDHTGRAYRFEDLLLLISKRERDRDRNSSA